MAVCVELAKVARVYCRLTHACVLCGRVHYRYLPDMRRQGSGILRHVLLCLSLTHICKNSRARARRGHHWRSWAAMPSTKALHRCLCACIGLCVRGRRAGREGDEKLGSTFLSPITRARR